jgi:hypothetical protein
MNGIGQILVLLIYVIVGTIILHIAAKIASVDGATLSKAFIIALAGGILGTVFGSAGLWAQIIGWVLTIVVIKLVYSVSWIKALIVWILYVIVIIVIIVLLGILFGLAFLALT